MFDPLHRGLRCYNALMKIPLLGGLAPSGLTLKNQPMFQDRISLVAVVLSFILSIVSLIALATRLPHSGEQAPVHYSSLIGFDQQGPWYLNFQIGIFSLLVSFINTALAIQAFRRNRLVSFFLLVGAVVVTLLCLIVSMAFPVVN
jgi:uncharacterized Tic20 family protein